MVQRGWATENYTYIAMAKSAYKQRTYSYHFKRMKNLNSIFKILFVIISIMTITSVYGQQDSISKKPRSIRNGLFINPTPAMIYSIWDFTPGYERVHKTKDRSWVITAGPFILSTMADSMTSTTIKKVGETRQGFHMG